MINDVAFSFSDMIYLRGREVFIDLKSIYIGVNEILLNYDGKVQDSTEQLLIEDNKHLLEERNTALSIMLNLGKFVKDNPDVIEDFATCYFIYQRKKENKDFKLNGNYKYLDINKINGINTLDMEDNYIKRPKYAKNKTLNKYLLEWFKWFGVEERDLFYYNIKKTLSIETLLRTLDNSVDALNIYSEYYNNNNIDADIEVHYHLFPVNDKIYLKKETTNLKDFLTLMLVSYFRNEYKKIRCCEYCGGYFFGNKSKKTCSQRCKDLKNHKYEKRKIRQEQKKRDSIFTTK